MKRLIKGKIFVFLRNISLYTHDFRTNMRKLCIFFLLFCISFFSPICANNLEGTYENIHLTNYPSNAPLTGSGWMQYRKSSYIGVRLGANIGNLFFHRMNSVANNTYTSFNVGILRGQQVGSGIPLFFESGLLYSEKGAKLSGKKNTNKQVYHLRYLEIPFVFKYKANVGMDDFTIQPYFGGFIACGVNGKIKHYDTRTTSNAFRNDSFKRFDAGIRLGCGLAFYNFYFDLSYDIGLFNIAAKHYINYGYDDFDSRIRTGCLSATIGVDF